LEKEITTALLRKSKTRKAVNTTARQTKSKVKKGATKTRKIADANVCQARSKVKKAVAKTRIESKKITGKGKTQMNKKKRDLTRSVKKTIK
jgi:hypothetical protein